jgi:undecaprenyl-diphosphatase
VDLSVAHALDAFSARHDGFEDVLGVYVGASQLLFLAAVVALFLIVPGARRELGRRASVAAAASAAVALLVAHFVSVAVDRPRPFVAHPGSIHAFLTHAADPSFPSDHSTAAFAIAVAVALRWRAVGWPLVAAAAIVAAGRVFLGLHYPSDVLAGAVLGAAVALLFWLPPIRSRVDRLADAIGFFLDRALGRQSVRRPTAWWDAL